MNFELRGLKADDLFPMFAILSKIGFRDLKNELTPDKITQMVSAFKEDGQEDLSRFVGFNLMFTIVEIITKNLPSCKNEIYMFLSSLSGIPEKEISELDMVTFTDMIVAVVQKDEFKDFFKAVAKLFK